MRAGGVNNMKNYKIAVAGTGYVGLSIATLLSQHHQVTAVDIVPEKVEMINNRKSPIQDDYIEKYLAEKELNLTATLDANPMKAEYLIPIFIGELLEQGKMSVKVLKTNDTWYGMTYHEDVAAVKDSFKKMLENGEYKADLFSDL